LYGGDNIQSEVDHPKIADVSNSEVVQLLNRFMDLDEILCGGDDIESDFDAIFFNIVASTIS
jgi:hypothetical protein